MVKDEKIILIPFLIVLILLFSILLYLQFTYGEVAFASGDSYSNLVQARTWMEGHPYKWLPELAGNTALPDHLFPFIESFFGGKGEVFIWRIYIFNLLLYFSYLLSVWKLSYEYDAIKKWIFLILSVIPAITYNFFLNNDFSIFIVAFIFAYVFRDRKKIFFPLLLIVGFVRPDGILAVLLLLYIRNRNDIAKYKKDFLWILSVFFIASMQFILNKYIGGSFISQGVKPQSLFLYLSFYQAIKIGLISFVDLLKSFFFSFYPILFTAGRTGGFFFATLFPFFIIFIFWGTIVNMRKWIPFWIYIIVLMLGDAFTVFSGIHSYRHIAHVTPFIMLMGIDGVLYVFNRLKEYKEKFFITMFSLIIAFELIFMVLGFIKILEFSANILQLQIPLKERILSDNQIDNILILSDVIPYYYLMDDKKCVIYSPALNGKYGRYIKSHYAHTELSELLQRENIRYVIDTEENNLFSRYFPKMQRYLIADTLLVLNNFRGEKRILYKVNWDMIKDKFLIDNIDDNLICDMDIGDPISEKKNKYKYKNVPFYPYSLRMGAETIDDTLLICDTGRYVKYDKFEFSYMRKDTVFLYIREGVKNLGVIWNDFIVKNRTFTLYSVCDTIYVNGKLLGILQKDFGDKYNMVRMIVKIPSREGINIVEIKGLHMPYHYWIYEK